MPIRIQMAKKTSLLSNPEWVTRSALERNLIIRASSTKAKVFLTLSIQPPDLGSEWSQPGKSANSAKGNPSARPNPAIATVNWMPPPFWSSAPTRRLPRIGPVQEKETITSVSAIKNIPPRLPRPERESILVDSPLGRVSSKRPKKESAKARKIAANKRFNHTFVEMLLRILALFAFRK